MPLLKTSKSQIGSVYLTTDGTSAGEMHTVFYQDWSSRTKKVKTVTFGLDGTPFATNTGVGSKGFMTFLIPSCTGALYDALKALANTTTQYESHVFHAQLGDKHIDLEVLDVIAPADEQWAAGDPVENVTVRSVSYGDHA